MTRRRDQLDRIEAFLRRLESTAAEHARALREHGEDVTAAKVDAQAARESAEAAHAGVQALADMLPVPSPLNEAIPPAAPGPPSAVRPAAGGGTGGEPVTAARRVPKTLKPRDM